ncbi:LysE family translocator [Antribacter sp. KLBMP9083]|uniref:LysE family translocator n=1 Tax=Antribacter soli TaxID=2910976 RepID=A0AA41U9Z5_9MICO|nr:LysE family transporter [Antribacter soli]MCF4122117.1 LysE family translocator [Antribacter soli]
MGAALVAGVVAGYAVALPVGAVATYLVGLAARHPWRVGAAGALGIATVDGVYALLAGLFGAAVTRLVEPVAVPLRITSAVVLVVLAARGALAAWRARPSVRQSVVDSAARGADPTTTDRTEVRSSLTARRAFARFVAVTAVNPATVLFFAVVVAGGTLLPDAGGPGSAPASPGLGLLGAALFGAGAWVASASWQLVLALGGTLLGRVLSGPRGRLATALASATLMVALAGVMLLGAS